MDTEIVEKVANRITKAFGDKVRTMAIIANTLDGKDIKEVAFRYAFAMSVLCQLFYEGKIILKNKE